MTWTIQELRGTASFTAYSKGLLEHVDQSVCSHGRVSRCVVAFLATSAGQLGLFPPSWPRIWVADFLYGAASHAESIVTSQDSVRRVRSRVDRCLRACGLPSTHVPVIEIPWEVQRHGRVQWFKSAVSTMLASVRMQSAVLWIRPKIRYFFQRQPLRKDVVSTPKF